MATATIGEQARYAGAEPSADHAVTGAHYVSIISGKRLCLALGPFESHAAALPWVDAVRDHVHEHHRDAWTYGFGTARVEEKESAPIGKLNGALGL